MIEKRIKDGREIFLVSLPGFEEIAYNETQNFYFGIDPNSVKVICETYDEAVELNSIWNKNES